MSKSQGLTIGQVRAVFRLLGEIRELGASPPAWRRHMLKGIARLVGADMLHANEMVLPWVPKGPAYAGVVVEGVTESRRQRIYDYLLWERDYRRDPVHEAVSGMMTRSFTRYRQQLVSDSAWYDAPACDVYRTLDCDQYVYSHRYLGDPVCIHTMAICRTWGRPAFTERERRIVDLLQAELARLCRARRPDWWPKLSPRLQQTLECLLEGASEKEIAGTIGISRHTIHGYVKAIYRRFDVGSHAQLLAKSGRFGMLQSPRLSSSQHDGVSRPELTEY